MSAGDWIFLTYLAVAAFVCVISWVDSWGTYYVHGRPSGLLDGLLWPLWTIIAACVLLVHLIRKAAK